MMKKILLAVLSVTLLATAPMNALAVAPTLIPDADCTGVTNSASCGGQNQNVEGFLGTILNWILFVAGALAVVMIVVGAMKFATSGGDSAKLGSAKKTLLYAVIGLVVTLAAIPIVNWVKTEATLQGGTAAEKKAAQDKRAKEEAAAKKKAASEKN